MTRTKTLRRVPRDLGGIPDEMGPLVRSMLLGVWLAKDAAENIVKQGHECIPDPAYTRGCRACVLEEHARGILYVLHRLGGELGRELEYPTVQAAYVQLLSLLPDLFGGAPEPQPPYDH